MGAVHIIDHPLVQHKLTFIATRPPVPRTFASWSMRSRADGL